MSDKKFEIVGDNLIFTTGKTLYANCGIIGISQDDDGDIFLSGGYDNGINYTGHDFYDPHNIDTSHEEYLTKEERIELADYAISLWQKFKESA